MVYLREDTPDEMEELVDYFNSVYGTRTFRRFQQEQLPSGAPPPPLHVRIILQ